LPLQDRIADCVRMYSSGLGQTAQDERAQDQWLLWPLRLL
jgi:hypothetical protein